MKISTIEKFDPEKNGRGLQKALVTIEHLVWGMAGLGEMVMCWETRRLGMF